MPIFSEEELLEDTLRKALKHSLLPHPKKMYSMSADNGNNLGETWLDKPL